MMRGRLAPPDLPPLPPELAGWHWERQEHNWRLVYGSRWASPWRDEGDGSGELIAIACRAAAVLSMEQDEMTIVDAEIIATVEAPLSKQEIQHLLGYEHTIERGIQTFVEVGNALGAINRGRLYRATHSTFDEYINQRWPELGTVRQAYRMMEAAEAVEDVTNWAETNDKQLPPPANEAQARPLTALPPEQRGPVYEEAINTAPNGRVTGAHIQKTVDKAQGKPALASTKPAPTPAPTPPPLQLTPLPATLPPPLALPTTGGDQATLERRKALTAKVALLGHAFAQAKIDLIRETQGWDQEVVISDEQARTAGQMLVSNPSVQGAATMLAFAARVEPLRLATPEPELSIDDIRLNILHIETRIATWANGANVTADGVKLQFINCDTIEAELAERAETLDDATYEELARRISTARTSLRTLAA